MTRKRSVPGRVRLSDEEMVVGDFNEPVIEPPQAWPAAITVQNKVLSGFHLLRSVRPDVSGQPMSVDPRREDKIYKTVPLAHRLMEAAVTFELPVLMAEITEVLDAEAARLDAEAAAGNLEAEN